MNGRSPFLEPLFTLFGTVVHPFWLDWVNGRSSFATRSTGCRMIICVAALSLPPRSSICDSSRPAVVSENPAIAVGFPATISEFNRQMSAFDKTPNDLLNATLGHVAFGGEPRDAGPGAAFSFVDKVGKDIGEHESERRQLGIGAHLFKPEKFFTGKRAATIRRCFSEVETIAGVLCPRTSCAASQIRIGGHPGSMGRVDRDRNSLTTPFGSPRIGGEKDR